MQRHWLSLRFIPGHTGWLGSPTWHLAIYAQDPHSVPPMRTDNASKSEASTFWLTGQVEEVAARGHHSCGGKQAHTQHPLLHLLLLASPGSPSEEPSYPAQPTDVGSVIKLSCSASLLAGVAHSFGLSCSFWILTVDFKS